MRAFTKMFCAATLVMCSTAGVAFASASASANTSNVRMLYDRTNGFAENAHPVRTAKQMGITVFQPPAEFNPLTASDAQLQKYGFPPRPSNAAALASWETAIKNAKTFIVPTFKTTDRTSSFSQPSSKNWSGYIDNTTNATLVQATFNVPDLIQVANQPDGAEVSIWDGLGGNNGDGLIQAGVDGIYHDTYSGGYNEQWATYTLWWEALPDYGTMQDISLSMSPGDTLYVECNYDPSTGDTRFYLEDETNQKVASFYEYTAADYSGITAEWVTERPLTTNTTYPYTFLANYGSEAFSGSTEVQQGTDYAIGNAPSDYLGPVLMYDSQDTILANASSLTSPSSFVDYWHNYGDRQ